MKPPDIVNPNAVLDEDGNTALHLAVSEGYYEEVRRLIAAGAYIDAQNIYGRTPLHTAVAEDRGQLTKSIAELLINAGANVNTADHRRRTAIHRLFPFKNIRLLNLLVSRGADVNAQDCDGTTVLSDMAFIDDVQAVAALIEHGANVNVADDKGETPLHKAVLVGNYDIMELLLDAGADVNVQDNYGQTAMDWAERSSDDKCRTLLISRGVSIPFTVPEFAVDAGVTTEHKAYSPAQPQPDDRLSDLHNAVMRGQLERIETIIATGRDVNIRDGRGQSPLHWAVNSTLFGSTEAMCRLLINRGADVNAKDNTGWTPLHCVASCDRGNMTDRIHVMEMLIAAGADVNASTHWGGTPVYFAASNRNVVLAEMLVSAGADVNKVDQYGRSPLHEAVRKFDDVMVTMLVVRGADINAKDGRGWTPLARAEAEGQKYIAGLLREVSASSKRETATVHRSTTVCRLG